MTNKAALILAVLLALAVPAGATVTTFSPQPADDGYAAGAGPYATASCTSDFSTSVSVYPVQRNNSGAIVELYSCWNTGGTIPATSVINSAVVLADDTFHTETADNLNLVADWYNFRPTLDCGDWTRTAPNTALDATQPGTALNGIVVNFSAQFPSSGSLKNLAGNVHTGGDADPYTCLRFSITQRAGDAVPTGVNSLWLYMADDGSHFPIRLKVDWTFTGPTPTPTFAGCCLQPAGTPVATPLAGGQCASGTPVFGASLIPCGGGGQPACFH